MQMAALGAVQQDSKGKLSQNTLLFATKTFNLFAPCNQTLLYWRLSCQGNNLVLKTLISRKTTEFWKLPVQENNGVLETLISTKTPSIGALAIVGMEFMMQ